MFYGGSGTGDKAGEECTQMAQQICPSRGEQADACFANFASLPAKLGPIISEKKNK